MGRLPPLRQRLDTWGSVDLEVRQTGTSGRLALAADSLFFTVCPWLWLPVNLTWLHTMQRHTSLRCSVPRDPKRSTHKEQKRHITDLLNGPGFWFLAVQWFPPLQSLPSLLS